MAAKPQQPALKLEPGDAQQLAALLQIAMHHAPQYTQSPLETRKTNDQIKRWLDQLEAMQ